MRHKVPILLSFYALSNGDTTLIYGQLTYSTLKDLSFQDYNRRKTFRTLFALYRTKPYANQQLTLVFSKGQVQIESDSHGSFNLKTLADLREAILLKVVLSTGEEVRIVDSLYPKLVHYIQSRTIVISDIDDTLLHSHIYKKLLKFRTLMFTTMEERKAVVNMKELLQRFSADDAACFYLSNSEQNLYPLIYRFLSHNNFPPGPLFLKKMRRLLHVVMNMKFPLKNIHKQNTLEEILKFFPDRNFVLVGDNTQHDLAIYLDIAGKFPKNISCIVIRKVVERKQDQSLIQKHTDSLKANSITLYYSDDLPHDLHCSLIPPTF